MVITLHDVIAWDHPEWLGRANVRQLQSRLPKSIASGAHLLTSSRYSRDRIIERLGVPEERVTVVPLGLDSRFTPDDGNAGHGVLERLGVTGPFVLTVGTLQPRKNLEGAIEAFELLGAAASEFSLIVVGARGWRDGELLERVRRSPVANRLLLLGRVSDDDLVTLYRGATCFVFPSRYEGFGFPPLEAMACGTPVVSSGRTSLAEVVADAGLVVEPDDPAQIAEQLRRVLESSELRGELRQRGLAHVATYSWPECARQTVDVYELVAR